MARPSYLNQPSVTKFPGIGHSLLSQSHLTADDDRPHTRPQLSVQPVRRSKKRRCIPEPNDEHQDVKPSLAAPTPTTPERKLQLWSKSYPTPATRSPTSSSTNLQLNSHSSPTQPKPKRASKAVKAESAVAGPSQAGPGSDLGRGVRVPVGPTGGNLYTLIDDNDHKPLGWDGSLIDGEGHVQVRAEAIGPAARRPKAEDRKPKVGQDEHDLAIPGVTVPDKVVVPPSTTPGRSVKWDPLFRTINTGLTKSTYRLDPAYLIPLDVEHTHSADGWPMRLYSEHHIQQAAHAQRGGRAHFQAYIQGLHNAARGRSMRKSGEDLPEMSLKEPPLGECPFFWEEVTEPEHENSTREVKAKLRKKKARRAGGGAVQSGVLSI